LIMYQGYADALIPTGSSVLFYKEVLKTLKPKGIDLDPFFRHFLVPGMQHCAGTPPDVNAPWFFAGPNQAGSLSEKPGSMHSVLGFRDPKHDILLTLFDEVWKQRPICPYPKQARYAGSGDVDLPESWACEYLY